MGVEKSTPNMKYTVLTIQYQRKALALNVNVNCNAIPLVPPVNHDE